MKRKKIIIIVLLIVVLIIAFVIIYNIKKNAKNDLEYTDDVESLMVPTGSYNLIKAYTGDNPKTVLYNGIYKFSKYLPKWQEDLKGKSETEIINYYKENIEEITACSGIDEDIKFVSLINYVENYDLFQNPKGADIDEDSLENFNLFLRFNITLKYENGTIPFMCQFDNFYKENNDAFEFFVKE